jgi:uncharacterized membrane protein
MTDPNVLEAVVGFLLVFFVPGFFISKALFPEWRVRGPLALRRLVEMITLSFVLSVVLTVVVGYLLLSAAPGGFQASWSDPVLESVLLAVTVVAVGWGAVRGAYRREPTARPTPPAPSPEEGAFELTERLDQLAREARRIRHALRAGSTDPVERSRLSARMEEIRAETAELGRRREAEYAE